MASEASFIIDPTTGAAATRDTVMLSVEDAQILRQYRKFLERRGLREALYCNNCYQGNLSDGCRAFVTNEAILIECRCSMRTFQGPTY